jgi:predicted O-linked N-acetylglucosamine transferase (SPINDLY family)
MQFFDCLAENPQDYIARAVRLASDDEHRRATEAAVFQAGQSLFADLGAVREHERLFHDLLESARG